MDPGAPVGLAVLGGPWGWCLGRSWLPVTSVRFGRDCYPLWVGNITPKISRKVLHGAFSR